MIAKLKILIQCAAFFLTLAPNCAHASIIVNLDAATNSRGVWEGFPSDVNTLPKGKYRVTPIDPFEGGLFTAWDYYGYYWVDGYMVTADYLSGPTVLVDTGYAPTYSSAAAAFANAVSSTFTLTSTVPVEFSVGDSYEFPDNQGGVSLLVSATPEPGTSALLGTGLAGLVMLLMRRTGVDAVRVSLGDAQR